MNTEESFGSGYVSGMARMIKERMLKKIRKRDEISGESQIVRALKRDGHVFKHRNPTVPEVAAMIRAHYPGFTHRRDDDVLLAFGLNCVNKKV